MKEELFSPAFNAIFPTLDEMIKHVSPNIKVRKVYALLRTKDFSENEALRMLDELITTSQTYAGVEADNTKKNYE
jgi:hypothetical protein